MQHLLLLHGAIGAKDQLQPLANCLGTKYKVHAINFNGHAGADTGNSFYIEGFTLDVLNYLEQNHIAQAAVFGYSMGGYVAMFLAKQHPQVISKIVTLATKFYWDEAIATKEIKMLNANIILEKLPVFAKQLQQRHGIVHWEMVLEKTKNLMLQLGKNNVLQLSGYNHISTPSLLLLGDKDRMVSVEETLAVQQALPHAGFSLLTNTVHPIEQVDVQILSALIEEFVQ